MSLVPRFWTFLEQIRAGRRAADLGQTFQSLAEDFGYTAVCIVDVPKLAISVSAAILFHTMPKSDAIASERRHPFSAHARFVWAEAHETPFLLEDVRRATGADAKSWNDSLPPLLRGLQTAILPVHRDGRLVWYVGCAGAKPETSQLVLSVLHTAAHVAFDRYEGLAGEGAAPGALSRREGACIRWIAAGKTDDEISAILRIAPRTVRFHVANAKKKLGVSTRVQAVAARLQRGSLGV